MENLYEAVTEQATTNKHEKQILRERRILETIKSITGIGALVSTGLTALYGKEFIDHSATIIPAAFCATITPIYAGIALTLRKRVKETNEYLEAYHTARTTRK